MDPGDDAEKRAKFLKKLRSQRFEDAQAARKRIKENFVWFERSDEMKYVKVLGYGGFGLVQLWQLHHPNGAFFREVAVKGLVRSYDGNNIEVQRSEIYWTKAFSGLEHMVQLVDLVPEAMKRLDINNVRDPGPNTYHPLPMPMGRKPDPLMVSEYSEMGTLSNLQKLVLASKTSNQLLGPDEEPKLEYIPNRVLWSIFLCLVRGLIAMAYPPPDPEANKQSGLVIRERIPSPESAIEPRKIVHFDIDIGNRYQPLIPFLPNSSGRMLSQPTLIQIADYGLMKEWSDNWDDAQKIEAISWGKYVYKAPETEDPNLARQPGVIGHYANVYQAMHELILQRSLRNNEITVEQRTVRVPSGNFWTYETYGHRMMANPDGAIFEDYGKVDADLRSIVMACMAKQTKHRPRLEFLQQRCEQEVAALNEEWRAWRAANAGGHRPRPTVTRFQAMQRMQPEPAYIAEKFYDDYFQNPMEPEDEYAEYWSKPLQ
ncbi:hypothetical protein F5Y17DRAFT_455031 [Xylariaceae sp. FL0594]|nr:hypothetical protein F5Y17DRAFT_455031 [Xylariaceae sp. FL0594]